MTEQTQKDFGKTLWIIIQPNCLTRRKVQLSRDVAKPHGASRAAGAVNRGGFQLSVLPFQVALERAAGAEARIVRNTVLMGPVGSMV